MTKPCVVLADLRKMGNYQSVGIGCLKSWAHADSQLRAQTDIRLLFPTIAVPIPKLAEEILAFKPRLVGFPCYVWNLAEVLAAADFLKRAAPELLIILGGPEASPLHEEILRRHPAVDYVALGEGEETFRRLLRQIFLNDGTPSEVPGLAYRDGKTPLKTAPAPQIDLAAAASPYLDGTIGSPNSSAEDASTVIMETSRGCPFTCKFCEWGPRNMRYMPISRVKEEFRHLSRRFKFIELSDADLLMHRRRGREVLLAFIEAAGDAECTLFFNTNPVFLHPEIVDALALSPKSFGIFAGVQSTNPEVFKIISRTFDQAKVEQNLSLLRRRAPEVFVDIPILYGLPGDDLAGFRRSVDWALGMRPNRLNIYHVLVLPGSDMHREAQALGLIYQHAPPHQVLESAFMDGRAMRQARELAFHIDLFRNFMPAVSCAEVEKWAGFIRDNGFDLTFGLPVFETDEHPRSDRVNEVLGRLERSPLSHATLSVLCRKFAQNYGKDSSCRRSSPCAELRPIAA